MVSQSVLYGITVQFIICFLLPIVLIVYLRKKNLFSWKALGTGIIIFLLFVNILERLLHSVVLNPESPMTLIFSDSKVLYVLYAILAAGLFEEFGRFVGYKFFLKDQHGLKDGLSYGIGHGGVELFTIGLLGAITSFMMFGLVNNGELASALGESLTQEQIQEMETQFIETPAYMYILSGLERVAALSMQIFLSLVVLLGVRKNVLKYVWAAVGLHAIFNLSPALYQVGAISNVVLAESIIFILGIAAFFGIKKVSAQYED